MRCRAPASAQVAGRRGENAPITAPAAFDDEDLKRLFDALEELNRRLWVYLQTVAAIFIVLFAVVIARYNGSLFGKFRLR